MGRTSGSGGHSNLVWAKPAALGPQLGRGTLPDKHPSQKLHRYATKCKFHHPPDVTPIWGTVAPATDVTVGLNKEVSALNGRGAWPPHVGPTGFRCPVGGGWGGHVKKSSMLKRGQQAVDACVVALTGCLDRSDILIAIIISSAHRNNSRTRGGQGSSNVPSSSRRAPASTRCRASK